MTRLSSSRVKIKEANITSIRYKLQNIKKHIENAFVFQIRTWIYFLETVFGYIFSFQGFCVQVH